MRGTFLSVCTVVAILIPAAAQIALHKGRLPEGFAYVRFANTMPDLGELNASVLYSVRLMVSGGTPFTFLAQDFNAPYQR